MGETHWTQNVRVQFYQSTNADICIERIKEKLFPSFSPKSHKDTHTHTYINTKTSGHNNEELPMSSVKL